MIHFGHVINSKQTLVKCDIADVVFKQTGRSKVMSTSVKQKFRISVFKNSLVISTFDTRIIIIMYYNCTITSLCSCQWIDFQKTSTYSSSRKCFSNKTQL